MNAKPTNARRALALSILSLFCLWVSSNAICQPAIPTNTYPVLDSWSFNDTNTWKSDLGYAPVSFTGLGVYPLNGGSALMVDSTNESWLQFNVVESDSTTNLTVNQGSILVWFAPSWTSTNLGGAGPGDAGRLIEVGSYTTNASFGWWSIYVDPEGENIYFSAQTNNGTGTNYLSAPISWTNNYFHQLVFTYSSSNTSFFMDGAFITNGPGISIYPSANVLSNGLWIGSDSNGIFQAHGIFAQIDTYSNQLDSNSISGNYTLSYIFYNSGLPQLGSGFSQAPSQPEVTPIFDAVSGIGDLVAISTNTSGCTTSSNVWITNVSAALATNGGVDLTFTIAGGSSGSNYDVFATPALVMPLTNGIWSWMGQGQHCVTYTIPGITNGGAFLLLGTPQDSDQDGLTDAYELLVSHTNPHNADTSGDGMLDGWKIAWGMNPLINNSANISECANYVYDGTGRLETNYGINAEVFTFDSEGNIKLDQQ